MFENGLKNLSAGLVMAASGVASAAPSGQAHIAADRGASDITSALPLQDTAHLTLANSSFTQGNVLIGIAGGALAGAALTAGVRVANSGGKGPSTDAAISLEELDAVRKGIHAIEFRIGGTFDLEGVASRMAHNQSALPADRFFQAIKIWTNDYGLIAPMPESPGEFQLMKDPRQETSTLVLSGPVQLTRENARMLIPGQTVYYDIFASSPTQNVESEMALVHLVNAAIAEDTKLSDLVLDRTSLPGPLLRFCEPCEHLPEKVRLGADIAGFVSERLRRASTSDLVWRMACGVLPKLDSFQASYFEDILSNV